MSRRVLPRGTSRLPGDGVTWFPVMETRWTTVLAGTDEADGAAEADAEDVPLLVVGSLAEPPVLPPPVEQADATRTPARVMVARAGRRGGMLSPWGCGGSARTRRRRTG